MRNLLAFAAFAVLVVGGVGWYRGWYTVQSTPTANGGRNININVNRPKIVQDIERGEEKVREILKKEADTVPNGVPAVFGTPRTNEFTLPVPTTEPEVIDLSNDLDLPPPPKQ